MGGRVPDLPLSPWPLGDGTLMVPELVSVSLRGSGVSVSPFGLCCPAFRGLSLTQRVRLSFCGLHIVSPSLPLDFCSRGTLCVHCSVSLCPDVSLISVSASQEVSPPISAPPTHPISCFLSCVPHAQEHCLSRALVGSCPSCPSAHVSPSWSCSAWGVGSQAWGWDPTPQSQAKTGGACVRMRQDPEGTLRTWWGKGRIGHSQARPGVGRKWGCPAK